VPGWFGQGSAPRLVCTTLKAEEHPDEIHKKNPRYLPMKNQPNSIFFQAFLEEKKKNEEKPSSILLQQLYRRERLCLWICVWKNEANKKQNTIFISFLLQLEFSPYFLALQLKKKWTSDGDCQY